jgi:hypothetical protein
MKSSEYYWQNFELGKELEIAGGFIYDGLRNLHEMETVRYESEIRLSLILSQAQNSANNTLMIS